MVFSDSTYLESVGQAITGFDCSAESADFSEAHQLTAWNAKQVLQLHVSSVQWPGLSPSS
jgi:hypothetical protein